MLVNNAGLIPKQRETTVDGLETQFAVNHLALFPAHQPAARPAGRRCPVAGGQRLIRRAPGRRLDFSDLQSERRYDPVRVYGRTKLANVLFTYELARRLGNTGVTANASIPV